MNKEYDYTSLGFICKYCGQKVNTLFNELCPDCSNSVFYRQNTEGFNYKCPNCKGEFNTPSYGLGYSNDLTPKCPWCGKIMEGLK